MGVRHGLGGGLVLVLLGALLGIPAAVPAQAAAPARTGTVILTIKTPAGVPGKVRLSSKGRTKVVKKKAARKSVKVRVRVPAGKWRVSPKQVSVGGVTYVASSTKPKFKVRAGATRKVTVTYRKKATVPPVPPTSPRGTLALTINAPEGVPGTVRLRSGTDSLVATKAPTGTSVTVRLPVRAGRWQVVPRQIVDDSGLFTATPTSSTVEVRSGATASATVDYTRAPSIRDLRITAIEPTRVQFAWTEPAAGAQYVLRRALGATPPAGVDDGTAVTSVGATATDTGVSAGQTYAYSVFAQIPGSATWVGPVSTVVSVPTAGGPGQTAAVVTSPTTVMITDPATVVTSASGGQVTVSVPASASATPALGQTWVLPPDTDIPTGYLGKVIKIAPDGRSVVLVPAGLADAFDYLDLNVPSFESLPVQVQAADRRPGSAAAAAADGGVISCDSGFEGTLDVTRDLDPFGDIRATLTKYEILGKNVPVGASFDGEFGVTAQLEAMATVDGSASCELNLPRLAIWFMAGPVPMVLTAQPTGSVGASGTVTETVGVRASVGAQFEGYFGLGGDDTVNGTLVTSIDPYANVTVAGDMSLTIGADIELGVGSGMPKAGALVGAKATFTALNAHATPVLGRNCLEVSADRSVNVSLEATAWLGDHDVSRSMAVPFTNASAPWGGSPWTYPNTCAPTDYRIASGTVGVTSNWAGACNDTGDCNPTNNPNFAGSRIFSYSSSASLRVADSGGQWVTRFTTDPDARDLLQAPMVFNSWNYDNDYTDHWSTYGCSRTTRDGTVGPVEFGGSYWRSAIAVAPLPGQALQANLREGYYSYAERVVGEWTPYRQFSSIGAWDTNNGDEFPRVPIRTSRSKFGTCEAPDTSQDFYRILLDLALRPTALSPDEERLTSTKSRATPLAGCTPEACRWQVQGTDTYEYRSTKGVRGYDASGGATVTWSFVVESRMTQPDP